MLSSEIPQEQKNTHNWMSIWRVLYRTLFYVAPKFFSPSLRGRSVSLENFERPHIPKYRFFSRSLGNSRSSICAMMDTYPSLSSSSFEESSSDSLESPSSYSSFERGINRIEDKIIKSGTSRNRCQSEKSYRRQKDKTYTYQYGSKFNDISEGSPERRKRSQSLSNTATKSFDSSDSDEVDLDTHLSTPYSEQWNKKHYRTSERLMYPQINALTEATNQSDDNNIKSIRARRLEAKSDNKEPMAGKAMCRLTIPAVASTVTSDDDDITPEVKYVGMLVNGDMFRNKQATGDMKTQ